MSFPTALPASRIPPAMEAPTIRWGILGTGWIADQFIRSVQAHTNQVIAAAGSRTAEKSAEFAARYGIETAYGSYEALVGDDSLDVIYVATPHNLHHDYVLLALNAGRNVVVEKPMALNQAQAAEMVALARSKGLFFAEALWTYFLPKFDVIAQLLETGVLGDVLSVYTDYGEDLPPPHRIYDATLAGGPLLDLGTYPVSLIARLIGVPTKTVGLRQDDPAGVHGQLAVTMAGDTGALATMATTMYGFTPTNAMIVGSQGSIRFTSEFNLPGGFELWSRDGTIRLVYEESPTRHFDGLYWEAAEVARCISDGITETPCRPLDDTLATMATLDAIRAAVGIDFEAAGLEE